MNAIHWQGLAFSAVAILVAVTALTQGRMNERTELLVMAVLMVGLGVPHGALDTVFAQELYQVRTFRGWAGFAAAYVGLAGLVVGLWRIAPTLFLVGFLVVSLAHFSGDPKNGTPALARIFYGGAILVLPCLRHAEEVTRLFSFLVGSEPAMRIASGLQLLAWPWIIGLALTVAERATFDWRTGLEMAAVGTLAVFAPPLVAFTVFFCGMHGARHILRTLQISGQSSARRLLTAGALPMALFLSGLAVASFAFEDVPLEARVIQLIFVALAALTVPHMLLVEQVRFSGWQKST